MEIRKLTREDVPKLLDISKRTFIEAFAHQNNPDDFYQYVDTAFTVQTLTNEMNTEGVVFYFLENETNPIGYFKLSLDKSPLHTPKPNFDVNYDFEGVKALEIERIYVNSDFHGKGAAQAQMNFIIDLAKQNGADFIWLGVWEQNPKAIRFYQKFGFEKFGYHIFDIGNDPQTDWLMWLKL